MKTVSQTTVGGADFGRQRGTFHLLLSAGHFQFTLQLQVFSNQTDFTHLRIFMVDVTDNNYRYCY